MKHRTLSVKQKYNPSGLTCYAVMVSNPTYKGGQPIEAGGRDRWLFSTYQEALADCERRKQAYNQQGITVTIEGGQ